MSGLDRTRFNEPVHGVLRSVCGRSGDIEGGVEIQTLADHGSEVWGVAWSTDGSIATVGRWGDVRIHSRDLDALERAARDRVTRSLTDAECRQYLHLDACQ